MALPIAQVNALAWQPYQGNDQNLVAQYTLDLTSYSASVYQTSGTYQRTVQPGSITAAGVSVDNTSNMNSVQVVVGNGYIENIPPYTKGNVILGGTSSSYVKVSGSGGVCLVTFYTGVFPGSIGGQNILQSQLQAIAVFLPPGMMMEFAGLAGLVPGGWLIADGSAISRTTYSNLFAAIGTLYGNGDGSSTFNLPNTQGRVIVGVGASIGTVTSHNLAETGGEDTHTLNTGEIPPHVHTTTGVAGYYGANFPGSNLGSGSAAGARDLTGVNTGTGAGLNGNSHNNMMNYITLYHIIKT